MRPRYALARRKAQELLARQRINVAPVPVEQLAASLGASIRYEPFAGELSGMVQRSDEGIVIGVNSMHASNRRRFTIAHEIGHLLLHKNEDLHIDERFPIGFRNEASSRASDPAEIEANQFAAELLMPSHLLTGDLKALSRETDPEAAVADLAARYEVSEQAMAIRLSTLGHLK